MTRRRGAVLIVTLLVVFALASLVLTLCGSMRVEGMAVANMAASLQAASIERGAEQHVLALLTEQKDSLDTLTDDYFAAVPVGDGYFWILRPDYNDDSLRVFGLTDESAKLNINSASYDMLMKLPNMTDQVAGSIVDWRDADDTPTNGGAEQSYYSSLRPPYQCKNAPFESVEELLLVCGMSRELLYGTGGAGPLGNAKNRRAVTGQLATDQATARGLYDLLTIYSVDAAAASGAAGKVNINDYNQRIRLSNLLVNKLGTARGIEIAQAIGRRNRFIDVFDFYIQLKLKPDELSKIYDSITASATTTPVRGRINVNTAPRDVLLCLPGLEATEVDKLISARQSNGSGQTSVAWVAQALENKAIGLADRITGKSNQYSADILAVSGNGRAFKRCRIVVNVGGATPRIVYRRDITERGWPMDQQILVSLRAGQGLGDWGNTSGQMAGGQTR